MFYNKKLEAKRGQVCFPRYKRYIDLANTLTAIAIMIILAMGVWWLSFHYIKLIDGSSMLPGINNNPSYTGDIAIVNRDTNLNYGDIVIIDMTESKNSHSGVNEKSIIKRVIALPGDTVRMRSNGGIAEIYVNGKLLEEDYISTRIWNGLYEAFNTQSTWDDWKDAWGRTTIPQNADGSITIPEGYFFFLGDNRANSLDGRMLGPMPLSYCIGTVENVIPANTLLNYLVRLLF